MKTLFLALLLTGFCISACNTEEAADETVTTEEAAPAGETEISTDAVVNPNTAAEEPVDSANLPQMEFAETEYHFGTIKEGETVEHTFKFTNTGASDLVISNARGSCGCTVPYYPKEPVAPGETAEISVSFNSKGKQGSQRKSVIITANTIPNQNTIYIAADVEKEE